jgi:PAS domain S-box-containing protein
MRMSVKLPSRARLSLGAKINMALGVGLLLLAAVGWLSDRSIDELVVTGRTETRTFEDLSKLERILAELRAAEAAQLRYLSSMDQSALADFAAIRNRTLPQLASLRARVTDWRQQQRVTQLRNLVTRRFELWSETMALRRSQGAAQARAFAAASERTEIAADIQRRVDEFKLLELDLIERRQADTAANAATASFLITWGSVLAMVLLLWAMVVIHRYQVQRQAAEAALRASERQMRLVTDAMPALIGYLDRDQRFSFHNRGFADWFGGEAGPLQGRRLDELLPGPAAAVVRMHFEDALRGEPSHFGFQLARDGGAGSHMEADLSASLVPHKDEDGRVIGCYVLVTDISDLKEVERMKAAFVSTVSHELRTPLTSIRGSLGLLSGGVTGALPEAARKLVDIARDNCERLVRLVNDILDSEKMASGKMVFDIRALELRALLEQALKGIEGYASSLQVQAVLESVPDEPAWTQADTDRLQQVAANLLSNACKFSPAGSVIGVSLRAAGGAWRVSVADHGPGIPEAFRDKLFQPFSQVDASDSRKRGGTGLGLSISRAIVERMGGRIGFDPREGGGTVFWFELPQSAPA